MVKDFKTIHEDKLRDIAGSVHNAYSLTRWNMDYACYVPLTGKFQKLFSANKLPRLRLIHTTDIDGALNLVKIQGNKRKQISASNFQSSAIPRIGITTDREPGIVVELDADVHFAHWSDAYTALDSSGMRWLDLMHITTMTGGLVTPLKLIKEIRKFKIALDKEIPDASSNKRDMQKYIRSYILYCEKVVAPQLHDVYQFSWREFISSTAPSDGKRSVDFDEFVASNIKIVKFYVYGDILPAYEDRRVAQLRYSGIELELVNETEMRKRWYEMVKERTSTNIKILNDTLN